MTIRFYFAIKVLCLLVFLTSSSFCQDVQVESEPIEFSKILDRVFEERMKPLAFEVKVRRVVNSRTESIHSQPIFFITEMNTDVLFDELPGYLYVKQQVRSDIANLGSATDGQSFMQTLNGRYPTFIRVVCDQGQFYLSNGEYKQEKRAENLRKLLPFPWENLGLVMPIELLDSRTELPDSIERLKKHLGSRKVTPDKDGVVTIDLISRLHRFDTKRGYWPIAFLSESWRDSKGKQVKNMDRGTSIILEKFGEHWLPKRIEINLNNSSESYDFEWKRFDSAIDEKRFEIRSILENEKVTKEPTAMEALRRNRSK